MIEVNLLSGSKLQFPDGTDPSVMEGAANHYASQEKFTNTAQSDTGGENYLAGIGSIFKGLQLGGRYLGGNLPGIGPAMGGQPTPAELNEWKQATQGLGSTPSGTLGQLTGGVAASAPLFMAAGPTAAGAMTAGGAYGLLQPTADWTDRLRNTAIGGATGGLIQGGSNWLAQKAGQVGTTLTDALTTQRQAAQPRTDTIQNVKDAGYVMPPSMVNPESPGLLSRVLEGTSGKAATQQSASLANQPLSNSLARTYLGLPPTAPLTETTLTNLRANAGRAYDAVASSGVPIVPDMPWVNQIAGVFKPYNDVVKQLPSQKIAAVEALQNDLLAGKTIDPASVVTIVKRLRSDGFANITSADPVTKDLGRVQLGAQEALESLMDRSLAVAGRTDLVPALQAARQTIARSYTVQKALDETSGNVIASKVGPRATNELATVRAMGQSFPKAVQNPATMGSLPGFSPLDAIISTAIGAAGHAIGGTGGIAAGAAWPAARMGARSLILSSPWQKMMAQAPKYEQGLLSRALLGAAQDPRLGLLGQGVGLPYALGNGSQ